MPSAQGARRLNGSVPAGKLFGRHLVVRLGQGTDHARMNRRPHTTRATLELETATEVPTGALIDGHGQTCRFSGWIELAAAIEDWRTSTARTDSRQAGIEAPG
jgi:hypothetical protein